MGRKKILNSCDTCRHRKVKCDGVKPSCSRCTGTGRKCDGYPRDETASLVYQPRRLLPAGTRPTEARALYFFHERAAPGLSGPYDSYFWTNIVLQLSNSEPAVNHAVIAISSLYEGLWCRSTERTRLQSSSFALYHYNRAVGALREAKHEPLVLVVCLLFICIEVLQENRSCAVTHCQHGIEILQTAQPAAQWSKAYLTPIFQRLASLPILFGGGVAEGFLGQLHPISARLSSLDEANYFIENIVAQTLELSRRGDEYRCGLLQGQEIAPGLLKTQERLKETITALQPPLRRLLEQHMTSDDLSVERETQCLLFQLRVEICTIWANVTLEIRETAFDQYLSNFRRMTELAKRLTNVLGRRKIQDDGPQFGLEIGYLIIIHAVVIKCRDLRTRLEALNLVRTYGTVRENFWDKDSVYHADRRVIEVEHNLTLDGSDRPLGTVSWAEMPQEENRILQTKFDPKEVIHATVGGRPATGSPLGFIMRDARYNLYLQNELICVSSGDPGSLPKLFKMDESQAMPYQARPVSTMMKCPLI